MLQLSSRVLRRVGALFLSVALVCSMLCVSATAADSNFVIESGVLTKYTGAGGSVTIPNSVTTIGEYALLGCPKLSIYGETGSAAETFAAKYDTPFVAS